MKLKVILRGGVFIMTALFLLLQSCVKDNKSNQLSEKELMTDAERLGLRGQVKSVKTLYFDAAGDKENVQKLGKSDGEQDSFFRLDKRGQKLQENWLDNEGNVVYKIEYNQDSVGKRVEKLMRYADEADGTRDSLRYDAAGRLIGIDSYEDGSFFARTVFKYDKEGLKQEQIDYDSSDDIDRKTVYDYDDEGRRIAEEHFNKNGDRVIKRLFSYDGDNISEIKELDKEDKLLSRIEIAYDENGLKSEENVFGSQDNSIQESSYSYELDEQQNWIKQTVFQSQKPVMIIEREVEYY